MSPERGYPHEGHFTTGCVSAGSALGSGFCCGLRKHVDSLTVLIMLPRKGGGVAACPSITVPLKADASVIGSATGCLCGSSGVKYCVASRTTLLNGLPHFSHCDMSLGFSHPQFLHLIEVKIYTRQTGVIYGSGGCGLICKWSHMSNISSARVTLSRLRTLTCCKDTKNLQSVQISPGLQGFK